MTTPIAVDSFDHLTLICGDLAATRAFYGDWLGLPEVPRPAFDFRGLWYQVGAQQVHVILADDSPAPAGPNLTDAQRTSRAHHFAFRLPSANDVHAAAESAGERGIEIVSGPKRRPDGAAQLFVADPDGFTVELCSAPPAGG